MSEPATNDREFGFLDPEDAHGVLQFHDAFRPVADRMATLTRRLKLTMASRKAALAVAAMDTYMMAKRCERRRANPAMLARLAMLRQLLGRKNRKR